MYCDVARFGSIAYAGLRRHMVKRQSRTEAMHEYRNTGLLWQVFELLNNDLGLMLGRDRPFLDIQDHVKRFSSRNGYSGSEYIFRDNAGYGSGRRFPGRF